MLKDWLWALTIAFGLVVEIAGWSAWLSRIFLKRYKIRALYSFALTTALAAQFYFLMSLLPATMGLNGSGAHLILMITGVLLAVTARWLKTHPSIQPDETPWHLRAARYFSPMSWRRALPWLLLPTVWVLLRLTDALIPSNAGDALRYHLLAPHLWFEDHHQILDPLHPIGAAASIWEALYYHLLSVTHALHATHRPVLERGQIAAQIFHFLVGQGLSILVLGTLIVPIIRKQWDEFIHRLSNSSLRHKLGMSTIVAVPASICFAWLACGQASIGASGTLAENEWGMALFVFTALALLIKLPSRALGFFMVGSAVAVNQGAAFSLPGFIVLLFLIRDKKAARFALVGFVFGVAPWILRNYTQTGALIYPPYVSAILLGVNPANSATPGWFSNESAIATDFLSVATFVIKAMSLCFGAIALARYLRAKLATGFELTIFTSVTALAILLWIGPRFTTTAPVSIIYLPALLVLGFGVLAQHFLTKSKLNYRSSLFPVAIPYLWFLTGLVLVRLPIHVLWQDFSFAFKPTDSYLLTYHTHYEPKHWASIHLPATVRIAWTSDSEFYYLEQRSTSIPQASLVHDALLRATNPRERAQVLCSLGFDVLAWEETHHGQEVAGLYAWMKLLALNSKTPVLLHTNDDVTLFDLSPACRSDIR